VHYESTREILLSEVSGLSPDRLAKIPYYIDLYDRSSESSSEGPVPADSAVPTVSVICRQDPRKGINSFLKAVAILKLERKLQFNCLLAGNGIFLEHNRRLAARLGIADQVSFLGFVDSVEEILERTDIYVLPSLEEGSGAISLLEAMKKGVAIVTTQCDGIPEDFVNGSTGLLVPPGDERALAQALERLILDRKLRETLAAKVREDYQVRFTFAKMQAGLLSVLEATAPVASP